MTEGKIPRTYRYDEDIDVQDTVSDVIKAITDYDGDPIDDYVVYDQPYTDYTRFDDIFGSIVYAMTPIGEEFYFKVKQRDGDTVVTFINKENYTTDIND